ncbi:MAG: hypothetical protein MI757_21365 [Pirellulales bacterium]|nr:hypothetical protein [Pirellulales bacterium]
MIFCVALVASLGCGNGGPQRVEVSGTVTYEGDPVEDGTIRFLPTAESRVPSAGGYIRDGRYEITAKGGVPVGTHTVRIEGYRGGSTSPADKATDRFDVGSRNKAPTQFVPARYNRESKLRVEISAKDGAVTRDFALTEKDNGVRSR